MQFMSVPNRGTKPVVLKTLPCFICSSVLHDNFVFVTIIGLLAFSVKKFLRENSIFSSNKGCGNCGRGLFSVEAEAQKFCRFRFHIGYLT